MPDSESPDNLYTPGCDIRQSCLGPTIEINQLPIFPTWGKWPERRQILNWPGTGQVTRQQDLAR